MANKYKFEFTKPPPISEIWSSADGLGTKLEKALTRFIQKVITWGSEFASELFVDIFDASMKIMRPGFARATDPIIKNLLSQSDTPAWYKEALQKALDETGESSFLIKAAVFYAGVSGMIFGGLSPIRRMAEYGADKEVRSFLPSIGELSQLNRIGLVSDSAFQENAAKLGLADPLIPVYKEFTRNLPAMGELFNGLWRGVYSEGEFKASIKRMGYGEKDVGLFLELSKNIPPLQDLIRMLVRDAFNAQAIDKYGYGEDIPDGIFKFFVAQGYDADWAKRFWYAHWNLPSPMQGYEMLHRGLIDQGTLSELLKISDYPPYWREKLIGMSYSNFTRVDIRRMYQAGVLTVADVLKSYKEIGYNDDKAQKLTDFATKGASTDEKDLTRSDILNLYEDNLLDRGEAEQGLIKMGYDAEEASQYMDMADFNIAKATRLDDIRFVQEQYYAGKLNATSVMGELNKLGLTSNQIDRYTLQWTRAIENKVVFPSKADAVKFYNAGLVDETKFRAMLTELGYRSTDIDLYVLQNTPEV